MRRRTVVGALCCCTMVAACGGAGDHHRDGSATANSGLPLSAYVVTGDEEPGYRMYGSPTVYPSAQDYAEGEDLGTKGTAQLVAARVQAVVTEMTGLHTTGLSFVYQLPSAALARKEAASLIAEDMTGTPRGVRFSVSSVPDAVGLAFPHGRSGGGNVVFVEGRCVALVGDQGTDADYRAPAVKGATAIWTRTHTHRGACSA